MDVHNSDIRSKNMAAIRNRDTAPEILVRKALYGLGYRYRLHTKNLPGTPDIVLPKYKAIILVNGCFWHKHDCDLFKLPKSRADFWRTKLDSNVIRDVSNQTRLRDLEWRVAIIWECYLKGKTRIPITDITDQLSQWLQSNNPDFAILRPATEPDSLSQVAPESQELTEVFADACPCELWNGSYCRVESNLLQGQLCRNLRAVIPGLYGVPL